MLRRKDYVRRAEQRVRAGGEHGDLIAERRAEADLRAGGASDPVTLLNFDALDEVDVVQIVEQALA